MFTNGRNPDDEVKRATREALRFTCLIARPSTSSDRVLPVAVPRATPPVPYGYTAASLDCFAVWAHAVQVTMQAAFELQRAYLQVSFGWLESASRAHSHPVGQTAPPQPGDVARRPG